MVNLRAMAALASTLVLTPACSSEEPTCQTVANIDAAKGGHAVHNAVGKLSDEEQFGILLEGMAVTRAASMAACITERTGLNAECEPADDANYKCKLEK